MNSDDESARVDAMLASVDPEIRIRARYLRRNKRLQIGEAKKEDKNNLKILEIELPENIILKKEVSVNAGLSTKATDPQNKLEAQLQLSFMQLIKLLSEGTQMVTNVRIANDAREITRKESELEKRKNQLNKLENAASISLEKFNGIAAKWKNIVVLNDPLDLHHDLIEQTKKCNELVKQKNHLAEELRHELQIADERFDKDKTIQMEDVRILTERINNQILVMKRAYRQELKLIEEAIDTEHRELQELHSKKWNFLYEGRDKTEKINLEQKLEATEKQEVDKEKIYQAHEETFRSTKIQLETNIQILQQELSRIQPMCIYSSEKLVYNYQVLKKRAEESIIMQAEQKRMLTKLRDRANKLRKMIAVTEKEMKAKTMQLREDLLKLQKKTSDIRQKAEHFMEVNNRQYQQIWNLNENNAQKMLKKLLDVDRIIHEQQLGMEWVPPDMQLLKLHNLPSCSSDLFFKEEMLEKDELSNIKKFQRCTENSKSVSERLLYQILAQLTDRSGFLMANRLKDILKPYTKTDEALIKIENIFSALGLQKEDDIHLLKDIFIPYTVCQICDEKLTPLVTEDHQTVRGIKPFSLTHNKRKNCKESHSLLVNPVYVLIALNNFLTSFAAVQQRKSMTRTKALPKNGKTLSRTLTTEDVAMFWARFQDIFPPECHKLWDGVIHGLQKYLCVVQNRHKINKEVENLRSQNTDLKRLLQNYIQAENDENLWHPDSVSTVNRLLPPLMKS